jgi:hypothetical protein
MNSIETFIETALKKAELDLVSAQAEFTEAQAKLVEMRSVFEAARLASSTLEMQKERATNPRAQFIIGGFNYEYSDPRTGRIHMKRIGLNVKEVEFPLHRKPGELVKVKMEELHTTIQNYFILKKEYDQCLSIETKPSIHVKLHKLLMDWVIIYDIINAQGCIGYENIYSFEKRLIEQFSKDES